MASFAQLLYELNLHIGNVYTLARSRPTRLSSKARFRSNVIDSSLISNHAQSAYRRRACFMFLQLFDHASSSNSGL
jgi:hypothetical protein